MLCSVTGDYEPLALPVIYDALLRYLLFRNGLISELGGAYKYVSGGGYEKENDVGRDEKGIPG